MPRAPRLWVQRARVHLWSAKSAPGLTQVSESVCHQAYGNCSPMCLTVQGMRSSVQGMINLCSSVLPKGTGKYMSGKHSECMNWYGKKIIIRWTGRLSWFLGHESNMNRMAERRNFCQRQPNPQLPDVGFLATSFEAACAGHCRRQTVESTVAWLMCYGYSCIPGTIQENET